MNAYQYMNPYAGQSYMGYAPQQQAVSSGIIWVHGDGEAAAYPVAPNNAVTLWDIDSPCVYLKQADASGKPSVKVYDLVERSQSKPEEEGYATKSDIAVIMQALSEMRSEISGKKRKKDEDE